MKNRSVLSLGVCLLFAGLLQSCSKSNRADSSNPQEQAVSQSKLDQIKALGFSNANVQKVDDGYLVEGDIVLTEENLANPSSSPTLRIANDEQYRTTNLVTGLPRVIKVKVVNLGTAFVSGTDTAIARYNALGLKMTFQRITSGTPNITIQGFNQGPSGGYITLGSSGFPDASGNPYSVIKMNTNSAAYGSNPNVLYVGSVLQHEIGHCIGMRHTDYMNRTYSCGPNDPQPNEGASNIGAILIPGTPSGPDPNSWMLACSNGGNRSFNANDKIALSYLYH